PLRLDCQCLCFHSAITTLYPLSLHDALPIYHEAETQPGLLGHRFIRRRGESKSPSRKIAVAVFENGRSPYGTKSCPAAPAAPKRDRKSTRLNSSHVSISYAVFCLKKKHILYT